MGEVTTLRVENFSCKFTCGRDLSKAHKKRLRKIHSLAQFAYFRFRRATFDSWKTNFIDKEKLAESGFVYLKSTDLVQCYFCKGVVGYWEIGDDPTTEHKKHFPNCPFVNGEETANIPSGDDGTGLYEFLNYYLLANLEHSKPTIPKRKFQIDAVAMRDINAAYPAYFMHESRLQSFGEWPQNCGLPTPETMAAAGFFYSGISDFVICFQCGGGLFNWKESDDPKKDHFESYGFCSFIRIDRILFSQSGSETSDWTVPYPSKALSDNEENLLLNYSFSKKLLSMGLSSHNIKKALANYLQTHFYLPGSLMSCIETIVDWEDQLRKFISEIYHSDNEEIEAPILPSEEKRKSKLVYDEVLRLRKELELEKQQFICRNCKERTIEVMILPCNHFHLCKACSLDCVKCPSCKTVIRGTIYPIMTK